MYVISRSANLQLPIRDREPKYHPTTGALISVKPAVAVNFQHAGTVPDFAKEAVVKMVDWGRGIGLEEDPFERCGCFDTELAAEAENWDDETKTLVEDVLRRGSGTLYVVADAPLAQKPWPNYDNVEGDDEAVAETIGRKVMEDGYDPKAVAAYERQNENRDSVLAVLDILSQDAEPDALGVIQA